MTKVIDPSERNRDRCGEIRTAKTVTIRGGRERKSNKRLILNIIIYYYQDCQKQYLDCYPIFNYCRSRTMTTSRIRTIPKPKGKKKKKRKRIIESDNQSENDEEDEPKVEEQCEPNLPDVDTTGLNEMLDVNKEENFENNTGENNVEMKDEELQKEVSEVPSILQVPQPQEIVPVQKIKKVSII